MNGSGLLQKGVGACTEINEMFRWALGVTAQPRLWALILTWALSPEIMVDTSIAKGEHMLTYKLHVHNTDTFTETLRLTHTYAESSLGLLNCNLLWINHPSGPNQRN